MIEHRFYSTAMARLHYNGIPRVSSEENNEENYGKTMVLRQKNITSVKLRRVAGHGAMNFE